MRFDVSFSKLSPQIAFSLFAIWLIMLSLACDRNEINKSSNVQSLVSMPKIRRAAATRFEQNLPETLLLPTDTDIVAERILRDYGAIFVARSGVVAPPKIVFESQEDCAAWQSTIPIQAANFGGVNIELQQPAMQALLKACGRPLAHWLQYGQWRR